MRSAFAALLAAILFLTIALRMGGTVGPATPGPEAVVVSPPGIDTRVPPGARTGSGRKERGQVTPPTEGQRSEAAGEDLAALGGSVEVEEVGREVEEYEDEREE